jgi:hypothetical protein
MQYFRAGHIQVWSTWLCSATVPCPIKIHTLCLKWYKTPTCWLRDLTTVWDLSVPFHTPMHSLKTSNFSFRHSHVTQGTYADSLLEGFCHQHYEFTIIIILQPFCRVLAAFFSFLGLYTVRRTPWTGVQPFARPLSEHRISAHFTDNHALSEIRTHPPCSRASEDSSRLISVAAVNWLNGIDMNLRHIFDTCSELNLCSQWYFISLLAVHIYEQQMAGDF